MTNFDYNLTPQELRLIECVAKGVPWEPEKYGQCEQDDQDPEHASQWHESRHIRAEVIRCLAIGGIWHGYDTGWPVHAHGIQIKYATITNTLECDEAVIKHSLWIKNSYFENKTDFTQAKTKHLSFEGSHLPGIDADGVKVTGNVFMTENFYSTGCVSFVAAIVEGQFDCDNGFFRSECGPALDANGITVGQDVFLRENFKAVGDVNFLGSIIKSQFQCSGGKFNNPNGDALNLRFAEIGSALICAKGPDTDTQQTEFNGILDLRQAKCRTFSDDKDAWPKKGNLLLDGFTYERFDESPTDWKARKDWLMRQPDEHLGKTSRSTFRPQPWVQASKVLLAMGHDADARDLALSREQQRTHSSDIGWWRRLGRHILEHTIGYGYKPFRATRCSLIFCCIGWLTFAAAGNLGYMQRQSENHVPPYNALIYALDAYLPVVDLGQDKAWFPVNTPHGSVRALAPDEGWQECTARLLLGRNSYQNPQVPDHQRSCGFAADTGPLSLFTDVGQWLFRNGIHRAIYWAMELAGWVLISLFIAGISGLMKKE